MLPVRTVVVVGGGTAGFLAAAALRRRLPDLPVRVIRSRDIGVIGVGEGSTPALTDFLHGYLTIDPARFFAEVRPTWKLGLDFLWGPRPRFQYTFAAQMDARIPPLSRPIGWYCDGPGDLSDWDPYTALMAADRAFWRRPDGRPAVHRNLSYHFENERFVSFLEAFARELGADVVDDTVAEVTRGDAGVTGLRLASGRTERADLYVDASGFASLLLGKALATPFESYRSSLYCDRAVVGGWDRDAADPADAVIRPYTTCETMAAGWCWRIEHEHRVNRGYVYCPSFVSDEEAEREFRAANPRVGPTRVVRFTSGRYRDGWAKNVVAVGNASGFVEPLEATALGVIAMQARLVAGSLIDADREVRPTQVAQFNRHHRRLWDNVRGFLAVHYRFNRRLDTPFWRECREHVDLADAAEVVDHFHENGPSNFWSPTLLDAYEPFKYGGYATLLVGMNVPYRRTGAAPQGDWDALGRWRRRNRQIAEAAVTVREALDAVAAPGWRWDEWSTGHEVYGR
ncbi:MAG TPA: FAD-dependent oxidoreductase [Humisphaera sp.]